MIEMQRANIKTRMDEEFEKENRGNDDEIKNNGMDLETFKEHGINCAAI